MPRRLQCVMAMARASEESLFFGWQPGRRILTMVSTCVLSALPTPVRAFFILFGSFWSVHLIFFFVGADFFFFLWEREREKEKKNKLII